MAGTATRVDLEGRTIKCNYSKKSPDGTLPSAWCHRGDRIRIFNSATVSYTGELTVESFNGGILTYSHLTGELCDGYTLQNIEFSPSCLIESCTVKRTRAHGFLFQNNDIEVRGCRFENMSSSAILAAPDLSYWYEVDPVDGMYIHHNEFIGNGFVRPAPTIATYTSHKGTDEGICDLHKNVRIENNVFKDTPGAKILLNSADGVVIKNNVFDENKNSESVILLCCTNVESDC